MGAEPTKAFYWKRRIVPTLRILWGRVKDGACRKRRLTIKHAAGEVTGRGLLERYCEKRLLIGHERSRGVPRAGWEVNTWLGKGGVYRTGASSGLRAPQVEVHASPQVCDRDWECSVWSPKLLFPGIAAAAQGSPPKQVLGWLALRREYWSPGTQKGGG